MKGVHWKYCLIFVLIPFFSFAQKDSTKVKYSPYISINAGIRFPSGIQYGQFSSSFDTYANVGPFMNIYATVPINNSCFGIAGMLGYSLNTYNTFTIPNTYDASQVTSINAGNFGIFTAMPGIYVTIPGRSTSINFRLLGGLVYFKSPQVSYTGEFNNYALAPGYGVTEDGTWIIGGESTNSFAIDIGASLKVMFSKRIFGILNADFLYSGLHGGINTNTQFEGIYNGAQTTYSYENLYSFSYTYLTPLDITIGICYKL
jgi:hypothetical protein